MFRQVARGVARNTSVILFQQVITTLSSLLLILFLPRYLGAVEYGRLFLATSIVGIFQVVVNYGGNYLITKEVSRAKERTAQLFVDSVALRLMLSVLSIGGIVLLGWLAGYHEETHLILLVSSISLPCWALTTTLFACFQGNELLQYTSYAAVGERVFISAVGITALLLGANAIVIAIILVAGAFVGAVVMWLFAGRIMESLPRVSWRAAIRQLREGVPYFFFIVFGTIYFRIDTVMLSKMVPEEIVGYYGAAYRFFESMNFPYLLTVALYPVLARLWQEESSMHRRTTQKSLEYVSMLGVLLTVGILSFANEIVSVLYGLDQYAGTVVLLQGLGASLLFLHINMILGATLLASDKQRPLMYISLTAIPVNVILNYFLIQYMHARFANGAIGSAIATGITEIFIMISFLRVLPKGLLEGFRYGVLVKSLVAGGVMSIAMVAGSFLQVQWVVLAIAGTGVYVASLLAMRTLEPAELSLYKGFIQRTIPAWVAGMTGRKEK